MTPTDSTTPNYGEEELVELTSFNLENTHERDSHIRFYPKKHIYTFDEIPVTPVSTVIASWFPAFDAESIAERKATKECPKEKLMEEWEANGMKARIIGTFMHQQIEYALLGRDFSNACTFDYHGAFINTEEQIDISRELELFQHFIQDKQPQSFRTEWRICDEEHHIAGTIDYLTRNEQGEYIMYDWKRSNKIVCEGDTETRTIVNDYRRHTYGLLSHLSDTPYSHYCLQQNLYRYMLRKHYGIELSAMYLVVLYPTNRTYHCVEVPAMDKEVEIILSRLG